MDADQCQDLYFLHERGSKMGIYMNAISGGNTIGPLICGFVVQGSPAVYLKLFNLNIPADFHAGVGWRWHKWLAVICTGINFLAVLLFVPETQYNRDIGKSLRANTSDTTLQSDDVLEKTVSLTARELPGSPASEQIQVPKKTYVQEISLWSGTPSDTNLLKMFIRPFPFIVYPAILFAFLGYAVSLAWVVAVNILNSFVLQAPPYNWGPAIVSDHALAALCSALVWECDMLTMVERPHQYSRLHRQRGWRFHRRLARGSVLGLAYKEE